MSPSRAFRLSLLGVWLGAGAASAQPPFVVGVELKIDVPGMTRAWLDDEAKRIATAIEDRLALRLNATFPLWGADAALWEFRADAGPQPVALGFEVVERLGAIELAVTPLVGQRSDLGQEGRWPAVVEWYKPSDIQTRGYPGAPTAAGDIGAAMVAMLIDETRHRNALNSWLETRVPIAGGARWRDDHDQDDLAIVLPLSQEPYSFLASSIFRVLCAMPDHGPGILHAEGLGLADPFLSVSDPALPSAADGLVVSPTHRTLRGQTLRVEQVAREELRRLHFRAVYLEEYRAPDLFLWTVALGGDVP